jgi:hypothetical protein
MEHKQMPDNALASLYPQPVSPTSAIPSLLQNPNALMGLAAQAQNMNIQGQTFRSNQAVGNAFQQSLRPDGTGIDPLAFSNALKNNPDAALGAGDAITRGLGQQGLTLSNYGQALTNANSAVTLEVNRNQGLAGYLAGWAGKDISPTDVNTIRTTAVRYGGDPTIWGRLSDPASIKAAIENGRIAAGGAANANAPVTGAPGPGGTSTALPTAEAIRSGAGGSMAPKVAPGLPNAGPNATNLPSGTRIVGNPPGFTEAAGTTATGAAGQGLALGTTADGSPVRKAMLGNLEADIQNFTSGPGADWTKVAKAWANRNVLPTALQFDPTSIASQEQFTKQAEQLAQQQFAAIGGTGTDAKFGSAFKSNPNDTLSQMGNTGIIRLLKGNEDAIQAKNKAWQDWQSAGNSPATYPQFARQFNSNFDPRVFQSQYMSQPDFQKMVKTMSPTERSDFVAKLKAARLAGYATDPGVQYNGQ